eukprot:12342700-Alexandrium_andersonii.AAC.1
MCARASRARSRKVHKHAHAHECMCYARTCEHPHVRVAVNTQRAHPTVLDLMRGAVFKQENE